MINPDSFREEHIRSLHQKKKCDPALVERVIFAFGLLEALARSELPFIFKGGSALLLLMNEPRRFSTDIDIIVEPGTDIEKYLEIAARIWPFVKMTEQVRFFPDGIEKRHYKFSFISPLTSTEKTILLDILFEKNPYSTTIEKVIGSELLLVAPPEVCVRLPNTNCILADKLTAFAPNTTGIPYHNDKEMEIIKQLYDIAHLVGYIDNFSEVKSNYYDIVETELKYRGIDAKPEDALRDTIKTAACIVGRGQYHPQEYLLLKRGISNIRNHIFSESFTGEVAMQCACIVMYVAAAVLTNQSELPVFKDESFYASYEINYGEYNKLSHIRKMDFNAYKYLVEAVEMLADHKNRYVN